MAQQYDNSAEFTEDLDTILEHLDQAHEIMNNGKFMNWLQQTDEQYDSIKVHQADKLNQALVSGIARMEDIYQLDK